MEPITTGALIAGGASLLGSGANAIAQGSINKKTRQYNKEMYATQKQDNIDFWNMQNSYNSPEQQMQRLDAAGVNKSLAFGGGNLSGNTASAPDTPKAMSYNPEAPRIDIPSVVNSFYDVKQKAAVTNNTKLQGDLIALDIEKKAIENKFLDAFLTERNDKAIGDKRQSYLNARRLAYDHMFKTGEPAGFYPMVGDKPYSDGSFYDLQAKSLDLSNQLRGAEVKSKKQDYEINTLRKNYYDRVYSPDASALSFKDWMQLLFQGASALK